MHGVPDKLRRRPRTVQLSDRAERVTLGDLCGTEKTVSFPQRRRPLPEEKTVPVPVFSHTSGIARFVRQTPNVSYEKSVSAKIFFFDFPFDFPVENE